MLGPQASLIDLSRFACVEARPQGVDAVCACIELTSFSGPCKPMPRTVWLWTRGKLPISLNQAGTAPPFPDKHSALQQYLTHLVGPSGSCFLLDPQATCIAARRPQAPMTMTSPYLARRPFRPSAGNRVSLQPAFSLPGRCTRALFHVRAASIAMGRSQISVGSLCVVEEASCPAMT